MTKVLRREQFGRKLRNFDGETETLLVKEGYSVRSGLADQFSLSISNPGVNQVRVALLPGHYDTSGFITTGTESSFTTVKTMSNPSELITAGYNVDSVVDDGSFYAAKGTITCIASNPSKTIRSFLDYIKTNPRSLKGLQIVTSDQNAFDSTLTVSSTSPFSRNAEKDIFLNDFFSSFQYQNDRITIDFSADQLEIADITLLIAVIPAGCSMKFTMRF
ncbi:MAG: hypothetical protein LBU51_01105 [Bacteroidales bacterium]|jgi:hypothetical protein|nr:hypothetical protein [Bacteroidales bacterium]